MDKLQWFKFMPTDWVMGKIQRCPEITQARFMRLICLYWNKECILSIEDAEIEIDKEHLDILIGKKIVKIEDDFLIIDFLNEQLDGIAETSQKRREAVLQRWAKVKQNNTSVLNNDTSVLQNDTEKSRVEIDKTRKDKNIPTWNDFYLYAKEKEPNINQSALKNKYDAWIENDWKNGIDRPIKNWKSSLLQTLIHLPKDKSNSNLLNDIRNDGVRR